MLLYVIEESHKMITNDECYHTAANLKIKGQKRLKIVNMQF